MGLFGASMHGRLLLGLEEEEKSRPLDIVLELVLQLLLPVSHINICVVSVTNGHSRSELLLKPCV